MVVYGDGTMTENFNFNPCPDEITEKFGLITSAVFGAIWRFSKMKDGVCWASQQKIAERCGITDRTVRTHIKILLENNYIMEQKIPGRASEYTPKPGWDLRVSFSAVKHETPEPASDQPRKEIPTTPEIDSGVPRKEIPTKKEVKKQNKKQVKKKVVREGELINWTDRDYWPENIKRPEIQTYIEITGWQPGMPQMPIIYEAIHEHQFTVEDLAHYWKAWVSRGYNVKNLAWLTEWAVRGEIPGRGNNQKKPKEYDPNQYTSGPYAEFINQ